MTILDPVTERQVLDLLEKLEAGLHAQADLLQKLAETMTCSTSVLPEVCGLEVDGITCPAPFGHDGPCRTADERTARADVFCAGDWVRPGTSPVWRQINNCAYCWCGRVLHDDRTVEHVVVALTGNADTLHLRKTDSLPYLTDTQFDRACRAEQDEADDRLHHAEWGAA